MEVHALLEEMSACGASDLHLVEGQSPVFRVEGGLVRHDGAIVQADTIQPFVATLLSETQQAMLSEGYDVSVSYRHAGRLFQCRVLQSEGKPAISVRAVMNHVPQMEELHYAPEVLATLNTLIRKPRGLLLVTGETGSGKQTLCASLLESVNREMGARIWMLENPITYEMTSRQALITQRQIGRDVASFEVGLQSAEDANVNIVYVSELRSLEAVQLALTLAETGHTVVAVMGVGSASAAIERLIDVFGAQGNTIRQLLAQTLIGVVAQRLLRRVESGRVPIVEILLNTSRVQQQIRAGQTDFTLAMEAGRADGMQTMDAAVLAAFHSGEIRETTAREHISDWRCLSS